MIEPNRDSENHGGRPRRLEYAEPEKPDNASHRAILAVALGVLFIPFSSMVCNALPGSNSLMLLPILLPLAGLAISTGVAFDRMASDRTRKIARKAIWLTGAEIVLFVAVLMMLPTLGRPRESAQRIKCQSSLKEIALAVFIYATEHKGVCPPSFDELLNEYITSGVLVCPSTDHVAATGATTQAVVQNLHQPGFCSYIYALPPNFPKSALTSAHIVAYEPLANHSGKKPKSDGINVVYGDGAGQWIGQPEAERVIAELEAGHNPPRPPANDR